MKFKATDFPLATIKIKGRAKKLIKTLMDQVILHQVDLDQDDDWAYLYAAKEMARVSGDQETVDQFESLFEVMSLGNGVTLVND